MRWIAAIAVLAAGCSGGVFGQDDGFRVVLARGCSSTEACRALVTQAQERVAGCQPNTIGFVRCSEARVDAARAAVLLAEVDRRDSEDDAGATMRRRSAQLAASAAAAQAESAREAARRAQESAEREEAAWRALDLESCSRRGDKRACAAIQAFLRTYPQNPHALVASASLAIGRDVQEVIAKEREEERRAEPPVKPKPPPRNRGPVPPKAPAPSTSPPPAPPAPICCCDATVSSCTAPGPTCCAIRGGVCPCR